MRCARLLTCRQVQGVVFSSGLKRDVFSAGNDIMELYAPRTSAEVRRPLWGVGGECGEHGGGVAAPRHRKSSRYCCGSPTLSIHPHTES